MLKFNFEGLGTIWWVYIYDTINSQKESEVQLSIDLLVRDFEIKYSRFTPESLVGKLNRGKKISANNIELISMLKVSAMINCLGEGLFDLNIGEKLEKIGYDQKFLSRKIDTENTQNINLDSYNNTLIELNDILDTDSSLANIYTSERLETKFLNTFLTLKKQLTNKYTEYYYIDENQQLSLKEGVKIDLGGIGKGWMIEKIRFLLEHYSIKKYTINAGGDIYSTGGDFYLEHPKNSKMMFAKTTLKHLSVATSSGNRRIFYNKHHIINPKQENYSDEYISSHITHPNPIIADVFTKIAFNSGKQKLSNLAKIFAADYLMVKNDLKYIKSQNCQIELFT